MKTSSIFFGLVVLGLILVAGYWLSAKPTGNQQAEPKIEAQQAIENKKSHSEMSFFVTSTTPGRGADLGGLQGADQLCQSLATSAGAGDKTWKAYLSTTSTAGESAVNARDRIGTGPWKNFNGVVIANNLEELHSNNNINKETALTEKGETVSGRGDEINRHDILTGSQPDGRAIPGDQDSTCGNWTKSGEGAAMVGHHDRVGLRDDEPSRSWNSSHLSRGCSQEALASSGGGGLVYCFAVTK